MSQNNVSLRSFTLIELLVAISIAVLLMTAGAFILSKSSGRGQVTADAELLSTFIGRARNYAANPEDARATGYGVRKVGDTKFEIYKNWKDDDGVGHTNPMNELVSLIKSKMDDSSFDVLFDTPAGSFNVATPVSGTLSLIKKPTTKVKVQITKPGYVDVENP